MKTKIFGISLNIKKVRGLGKFIGLMFRSRNTGALFFELKTSKAIHSFFCHEFYAVWLDKKKKIIQINKIKPFTLSVSGGEKAKYLIEIPRNSNHDEIIKILDGKRERFKY